MVPVIETNELTRCFGGVPAVDGLGIDVAEGEVVGLLGPNGAGKTTTVRLLNGVLRPHGGSCRVLGLDPWASGDDLRRRTGVLTESAALDERLSVRENLVHYARIRRMATADARRRADAFIERLDMGPWAGRPMAGLSTGQRKRASLALALLHEPEVLFLDEPTSGLDPAASRDVVDLLAGLVAEHRRTALLCTHLLADAGRLCHRVAVLSRGRLRAFGTLAELAGRLWQGLLVDLDLGRRVDEATLGALRAVRGVLTAEATAGGAEARVADREVVPALVEALVGRGVAVYGAAPRVPSLEDVYFALQADGTEPAGDGPAPGAGPVLDRSGRP